TEDPVIRRLRRRQQRNFMATLFLSQGVPMLSGGDELGRTQLGNNNAYCQDHEISWTRWQLDDEERDLLAFVRRLARILESQPALQRRRFFKGTPMQGSGEKDIMWLSPSGEEMTGEEWNQDHVKCLGVRLSGAATGRVDERGRPIPGETLAYHWNAGEAPVDFVMPAISA